VIKKVIKSFIQPAPGQFQGSFRAVLALLLGNPLGLIFFACASSAPPPNHLVPVFSCEKALNIKKIKIIKGLGLGWAKPISFGFRRGDFDGLRSALQAIDLSTIIQQDSNINEDWLLWKDTFLTTVTPVFKITRTPSKILLLQMSVLWQTAKSSKRKQTVKRHFKPY
jgi:hypothetical protein